jgi:hypothetical protein
MRLDAHVRSDQERNIEHVNRAHAVAHSTARQLNGVLCGNGRVGIRIKNGRAFWLKPYGATILERSQIVEDSFFSKL